MKVLFLDIDGVLNSREVLIKRGRADVMDSGMVEQINRVVQATDCKIVISSTWRLLYEMGELRHMLRAYGLWGDVVVDKTPTLKMSSRRDEEIKAWLAEHAEVTQFAVVDDDVFDLTDVSDRLVATSFETGILPEHADRLIELLS